MKEYCRQTYTKVKLMLSNGEQEPPPFRLIDKKDDDAKEEIPLYSFSDVTAHVRYLT